MIYPAVTEPIIIGVRIKAEITIIAAIGKRALSFLDFFIINGSMWEELIR